MSDKRNTGHGRWMRRPLWAIAGIAGALTLAACSGPGGPGGPGAGPDGGPGWGHHHRHGHGQGWAGGDPAKMGERVDKMVDRVLSSVDGTAEQKQKVSAIVKQAMTEMAPLRERHQAARRKAVDILAAPNVDRAAIETLRAEEVAAAEQASRRLTQAIGDVAEVLTPEQRVKLKERFENRRQRRWG